MATKPDLRQIANSFDNRRPMQTTEPAREAPIPIDHANNPNYRPSREGKATVSGYYPREVRKQLRSMAADKETTIEDLLAEALNDLFAKYQRPEIAPRKERL
jgi:hypothetical protein